jgi:hypothetical protein
MQPCKTLFIKYTVDLENVQRNKKKEKGEFTQYFNCLREELISWVSIAISHFFDLSCIPSNKIFELHKIREINLLVLG